MSEQPELWTCPQCGAHQDISQLGFHVEIVCPQCDTHAFVHGMLANYKIESVLGIGGMSVVFQARDLVLGRPLAIKVLNDTYRDEPERIAGIGNECALMAKVRHENVVSVYSAGWARGQFYIAMELVEGINLELLVAEQGYLQPLQAIEIIRQVALGLQAAHETGILHRDVKPGNVLITPEGHAKVLDFGLSQDEKNNVDEETIIWATPYYVPPETLRQEEEKVQADIYALGMTMRNLLTGEAALKDNPQTIADMLISKKMLPSLSEISPNLDSSLCELVDWMTSYNQEERPVDYAEVLEAIVAVQQKMTDDANPELQAYRARQKFYVACGGAASVLIGLLGGFIVALLTPAEQVHEALLVNPLQWAERDMYEQVELELKSGDRVKAAEILGDFMAEHVEPTLSAVAVLHRMALDVLDGKSTANGYKRFAEVVDRADKAAPAGIATFNQMAELVAALRSDAEKAVELAVAMGNPLLKFTALTLAADTYLHRGDLAKAELLIAQAGEVFSGDDSAALKTHVAEYRNAAPRRAARVQLAAAKDLFRDGQFDAAIKKASGLENSALGPQEKEEIAVMAEASTIMLAVHETLRKHGRHVSPGMPPDDLRTAAAGMGETDSLPREFYCLALLLSGDFETAFRENPYAADEESKEPFAIMMRDWKSRLGK